ncbi:MAG: response regulator [Candidatus Ratteibacteria bacterium]|nr:response regulator [Candidatus Ratteibacteria bacterium]
MVKRILIIDDDMELCEELSEILEEEGFEVDCAFTPAEGQKQLKTNKYDIVLLDFKLPQMSGIDFLKKEHECLKNKKVFIISGSLSIKNLIEEQNLSHLVSGVFSKPFDIEALLRELKK